MLTETLTLIHMWYIVYFQRDIFYKEQLCFFYYNMQKHSIQNDNYDYQQAYINRYLKLLNKMACIAAFKIRKDRHIYSLPKQLKQF